MKKGSFLIGLCGGFNIIFAIYLFVLCTLLFTENTLSSDLTNGFVGAFNSLPSEEVTRNGFLTIFVILAALSLFLAFFRFKQLKVEAGLYFKNSSKLVSNLIYNLICSALFFVLFGICNQSGFSNALILVAAIISLVSFLICLLAIVVFLIEKKNALKPKPSAIVASGDHYTAMKKLSALKDSKEISEKEYQSEKEKILGK